MYSNTDAAIKNDRIVLVKSFLKRRCYSGYLPIKWMTVELLKDRMMFSSQSDVWRLSVGDFLSFRCPLYRDKRREALTPSSLEIVTNDAVPRHKELQ